MSLHLFIQKRKRFSRIDSSLTIRFQLFKLTFYRKLINQRTILTQVFSSEILFKRRNNRFFRTTYLFDEFQRRRLFQ